MAGEDHQKEEEEDHQVEEEEVVEGPCLQKEGPKKEDP